MTSQEAKNEFRVKQIEEIEKTLNSLCISVYEQGDLDLYLHLNDSSVALIKARHYLKGIESK